MYNTVSFNHELKKIFPYFDDKAYKVIIHHDKTTSHTAANYIENINKKYGMSFLNKVDTPVKGADISLMDFFGFGYIKQGMKNREQKLN